MKPVFKIFLLLSLIGANLAFVGGRIYNSGGNYRGGPLSRKKEREYRPAADFSKKQYIDRLKGEQQLEATLLLMNRNSMSGDFHRAITRLEQDSSKRVVVRNVRERLKDEELQGVSPLTFYRLTQAELEDEFLRLKKLSGNDLATTFKRVEDILTKESLRKDLSAVEQRKAALRKAMFSFIKGGGRLLNNRKVLTITSPQGLRNNPVTGAREYHPGIDIAVDEKSHYNIYGKAVYSGWSGRIMNDPLKMHPIYGYNIRVEHGFYFEGEFIRAGFISHYSHLRRKGLVLKKDSYVKGGQVIGRVGSTGLSTNPHLDWEVYSSKDCSDGFFTELYDLTVISEYGLEFYEVESLFNRLF